MYELIIDYGLAAIGLLFSGLAALLGRLLIELVKSKVLREHIVRLGGEVESAVREVLQTYVSKLKEYNADGKLTDEEKAMAKKYAIEIAKSNFGSKGLLALGRIFDVEKYIGGKVEAVLGEDERLGELLDQ